MRKDALEVNEIYHIFTKSIAEFRIFNNSNEFTRLRETIRYYQIEKPKIKFSDFIELEKNAQNIVKREPKRQKLVEIIAYCLMPTHVHLVLQQLDERGISIFMNNVLNSYSKYFNIRHNRRGPLWECRFKNILVQNDEQLLHLTRYIHLNPVTAYLVDKPEFWLYSSYSEYLQSCTEGLCSFHNVLEIRPAVYKSFVEDRITYQRDLAKIKSILLEPLPTA